MQLKPSRDEIVGTAMRLLRAARERGIRVSENRCDRRTVVGGVNACQQQLCFEPHLLGGSGNGTAFSGDDLIEGQYFQVFGDWNVHANRYQRIWAYFPGILGNGESVDVTAEVLGEH